jgi:hypothetical protein
MTQAEGHDPAPAFLSRNEIETLCLKAARGAGMSWGLAEEAGFAAAWLAARGVDGAGALLAHLQNFAPCVIFVHDRQWRATNATALCPIMLGATLDDHCVLDAGPWSAPITIDAVSQPILLVPFLARGAQTCAKPLALTWPGGSFMILANGDVATTALTALSRVDVTTLTLSPASDVAPGTAPGCPMASLSAATFERLNTLALRTTVPASDTSRRGAGAATSDND